MNVTRIVVSGVGLAIVVAGTYLLYFEAALHRYLTLGELTAGVVVLVGLVVMMIAGLARREPAPSPTILDRHEIVHDQPASVAPVIVQTPEPRLVALEHDAQPYGPPPAGGAKWSTGYTNSPYMAPPPAGPPPLHLARKTLDQTETTPPSMRRIDHR